MLHNRVQLPPTGVSVIEASPQETSLTSYVQYFGLGLSFDNESMCQQE